LVTADLPTGTVTFLFTDVEGSTKLWERFPTEAGPALACTSGDLSAIAPACSSLASHARAAGERSRGAVWTVRPAKAEEADGKLEEAERAVRTQIGVRTGLPDSITVAAGCLARLGRPARAARLFGAADALRAAFGEVVHAVDAPGYEADIGLVRAALTPEEFEQEWAVGGAMNLETAVALALEQHPAS
jgi:class 3 adenylate cyclase